MTANHLPDSKPSSTSSLTIGIVVGEESGDILGAGLMKALKTYYPNAQFEGIGGPRMIALGFKSLFAQDRLAVMGFIDPLKRLPELLGIRKSLKQHFIATRPTVFIGIDAPDFNLGLEKSLRAAGILTTHYVSPSVWAWRQGRIKTIAKAVDLMLALLPFEKPFYKKHGVHAEFVGHPLADEIPLEVSKIDARKRCGFRDGDLERTVVALLPGSRGGEVERLGPVFFDAARGLQAQIRHVLFLVPAANEKRHAQLQTMINSYKDLPIKLFEGQSHDVMAAADVVLMASGTTSLEALLLKRPMVIAYKMAWFSYWLMSKLAKVQYVGLPNLLADREIVTELLQDNAQPDVLCSELLNLLRNQQAADNLQQIFRDIHLTLKQNASAKAAQYIHQLIVENRS